VNMNEFIAKFLYVTTGKHQSLLIMFGLFITSSFLEMVGLGLIGPFSAMVTKPDSISSNIWLQSLYVKFSINSSENFILYFGILTIVIFYFKSALSFFTQKSIAEFSHSLKGNLSSKLMKSYLSAPYTLHLSRNSADLVQSIVTFKYRFCIGLVLSLITALSN
ncbi:MAG: hypothetical protein RLZZ171_1413, partial [Cyanobacteriota bacterium]